MLPKKLFRKKRFSEKAPAFNNFIQSRRQIQRNLDTGIVAQGQQKGLSEKRVKYQTFTQKHKENRNASKLADTSQEELLRQRFSEKAQEVQTYVSTHKKK